MSLRLCRLLLLSITLLMLQAGAPARAAERVAVLTSAQDGAYAETVGALREGLRSAAPAARLEVRNWEEASAAELAQSHIVVTVGTQAAQVLSQLEVPVPTLHVLLPQAAYEKLPRRRAGAPPTSAVFLDHPAERQITLLRLALPDWPRLALLSGPNSHELVARLGEIARSQGLQVQTATVEDDRQLYTALQHVLAEPSVLLATPDTVVFNSYTVQNVLLTAYRQRSPVLGFSAAYVRAGALLGLYSTPAQIGGQAAEIVARILRGDRLPAPAHPTGFEVAINPTVARSLGIGLRSGAELALELRRREEETP